MRQPRILMCPPDYYGIEYEINPWMNGRAVGSDPNAPARQWEPAARHAAQAWASTVELMAPQPGLPDLVFTANAGLVFGDSLLQLAVPPRGPQRESPLLRRLVRGPRLHGRTLAAGDVTSRGPATPCSAARRCSPATASAATCRATSSSATACCVGRSCRWSWSTPASTTSIRASARWRPARRSAIPRRSTTTAGRCCKRTCRT